MEVYQETVISGKNYVKQKKKVLQMSKLQWQRLSWSPPSGIVLEEATAARAAFVTSLTATRSVVDPDRVGSFIAMVEVVACCETARGRDPPDGLEEVDDVVDDDDGSGDRAARPNTGEGELNRILLNLSIVRRSRSGRNRQLPLANSKLRSLILAIVLSRLVTGIIQTIPTPISIRAVHRLV